MSDLTVLDDAELLSLHERLDLQDVDDPAAVEAHHLVATEILRRGGDHGHAEDHWSKAVVLVDSTEVESAGDIEAPEGLEKAWGDALADGGTVSVLLTVDGYVLKADPTVSDVHVDAVMGSGRKRQLEKTIRQEGSKWVVYSEDGSRSFGSYDSEDEAKRRLAEVESFKKAKWSQGDWVKVGKKTGRVQQVDDEDPVTFGGKTVEPKDGDPAVLVRLWREFDFGWGPTKDAVPVLASDLTACEDMWKAVDGGDDSHAVPAGVQAAARQALKWIDDGKAGSGFTSVGRNRARQLADGGPVSTAVLVKMRAYFARHIVDKDAEGWGDKSDPTPGMVAWYAWGGDAGRSWVSKVLGPVEKTEKAACPRATQDIETNLKSRAKAIRVADYGPMNPNDPNEDYWSKRADEWDVSVAEAKKQRCGNCAAFNVSKQMKDCIAKGIGGDTAWDVINAGELGFCEAFDFKCAAKRTCDAWIVGGPIRDSSESTDRDSSESTEKSAVPVVVNVYNGGPLNEDYSIVKHSDPSRADYAQKHPGSVGVAGVSLMPEVKPSMQGAGGVDLPADGKRLIQANLGSKSPSVGIMYHPSWREGRRAWEAAGKDASKLKSEIDGHIKTRDEWIGKYSDQVRTFEGEGAAGKVAYHQGYIDGMTGSKARYRSESLGLSEMIAAGLWSFPSGAMKSAEELEKHSDPSRPDYALKHPRSPRVAAGVAATVGQVGPRAGVSYSRATQRAIDSKPDSIVMTFDNGNQQNISKGVDSLWHHSIPDGKGGYVLTRERAALHEEMIRHAVDGIPTNVDNPTLLLMGGGGGSGKGTLLQSDVSADWLPDGSIAKGKHVRIDADELKMALPEYPALTASGHKVEVASFTHEESSHLTKRIQKAAEAQRSHIVLDGTGDSKQSKVEDKIQSARSKGYSVVAEYVTAPERTQDRSFEGAGAWERNIARAKDPKANRGLVPSFALLEAHTMVSRITPAIAPQFDSFRLWDTTGGGKRVIASTTRGKDLTISDPEAWAVFEAKGRPGMSVEDLIAEADKWTSDITLADARAIQGAK